MSGYYFLILIYKSGRISIRDKTYSSLSAAEHARRRRLSKPGIKDIQIHYQYGIADLSAVYLIP